MSLDAAGGTYINVLMQLQHSRFQTLTQSADATHFED